MPPCGRTTSACRARGHYRLPARLASSPARPRTVRPWDGPFSPDVRFRPMAGRFHSHVLRRVRPDGAPGVSLSRPSQACSRPRVPWTFRPACASAGAHDRPSVRGGPTCRWLAPPAPSGLARGTGRPVWRSVRASRTAARERSARSSEARPGFWASLPRAIRGRRRSSFSPAAILPWALGPSLRGAGGTTCSSTRSHGRHAAFAPRSGRRRLLTSWTCGVNARPWRSTSRFVHGPSRNRAGSVANRDARVASAGAVVPRFVPLGRGR